MWSFLPSYSPSFLYIVNPSHLPPQGVKFAKAANVTTDNLMKELPKAKLMCPASCHERNPKDSDNWNDWQNGRR